MNKVMLVLVLLLVFAAAYLLLVPNQESAKTSEVCFKNGKCVSAEIAETPQEQERGLMYRTRLGEGEGMLFVFQSDGVYTFWMKSTLIPLDMIWINSSKQVVRIEHAIPCREDPCAIYNPMETARYVLEAEENYTIVNGIKIGDTASF